MFYQEHLFQEGIILSDDVVDVGGFVLMMIMMMMMMMMIMMMMMMMVMMMMMMMILLLLLLLLFLLLPWGLTLLLTIFFVRKVSSAYLHLLRIFKCTQENFYHGSTHLLI